MANFQLWKNFFSKNYIQPPPLRIQPTEKFYLENLDRAKWAEHFHIKLTQQRYHRTNERKEAYFQQLQETLHVYFQD